MNRSQRRKLGQRGPLLSREERIAEREEAGAPVVNNLSTRGMRWYAWSATWATAHLTPEHCVTAFMEGPAYWGERLVPAVSNAQIRARRLPACVECIQRLVAARNSAMRAGGARKDMLDARFTRRRLRVAAAAA